MFMVEKKEGGFGVVWFTNHGTTFLALPICVDINKLFALVRRTAGQQVGGKDLEVLATEHAEDGGVWLQVRESRERVVMTNPSGGGKLESGRSINLPSSIVRADRCRRVRSMRPHGRAV